MKRFSSFLFSSVSVLALGSSTAFAQDAFDLGEITVFSNLTPTEVNRTGVSVEVLDQETLQSSSNASAAETLSRIPGVNVNSNGGPGKSTDLRIRGLSGRYPSYGGPRHL